MEEESIRSTFSNLTNNDNVFKCAVKDSLNSQSSTNNTNSYSTSKSLFSNSTIRTALSIEEIESRRSGFSQFINSLPKICSPTICGTLNYKTPNSKLFASANSTKLTENKSKNDTSGGLESGYQTSSQNKVDENLTVSNVDGESTSVNEECDEQRCKNPFEEKINRILNQHSSKLNSGEGLTEEENNEFDWSIDQIALLNPCDITFDDNFLLYKEFEELHRPIVDKESEEFFKQNVIAPSPIINTPILARKRERIIQNMCKTSSPFIDYLNSKKKNMFKTPLQPGSIRSTNSNKAILSSITPHTCTPINELSVIDNIPKKKLFHEFESSSLIKSTSYLDDSKLSEIKFNCIDLDIRRFTLDMSGISDVNLNESDHIIKSSTNRKEIMNRLFAEDLLEEDEKEIQELNLNDTNEEINCDDPNLSADEPKSEYKEQAIETVAEANFKSDNLLKASEEDVQMSISMDGEHEVMRLNDTSFMECSFRSQSAPEPISDNRVNNVNQLFNQINQISSDPPDQCQNHINQSIDEQSPLADQTASAMMETSIICLVDNFNDKIDPVCISSLKNHQQLTSTPFRF